MVLGIGTDIAEIDRIERVLARQGERFLSRLLTDRERAEYERRHTPIRFLANRFAGKEAVAKALGCGIAEGVTFANIEILPDERGAPSVTLSGAALQRLQRQGAQQVLLSLADERRYAVAYALIQ